MNEIYQQIVNIFLEPIKLAGQSIVLVIIYAIIFLVIEGFSPKFKSWLDTLFIIVLVLTLGQKVMDSFYLIAQIAKIAKDFFLGLTPILISILSVLNAVFSFIAWSPIVIFIFQFLIFLCSKVLIPGIVLTLIFDFCTRFFPEMSFSKGSDLIRSSILTAITATLILLLTILSFTGVAFFTVDKAIASPAKKVIEQTIPIVGSLIVEGFSIFQKYQSTVTTIAGFGTMTAFWITAFYPAGKLLIHALTFKIIAALIEPFTSSSVNGLIDDVGKSIFVLCAVAILLGITFVFIWLIFMVILQIGVGKSF